MVPSNTYWRSKLSPEYANAYDIFMQNISKGKVQASFYVNDGSKIQNLIKAIIADAPQYFWLDPTAVRIMQNRWGYNISFSEIYNRHDIVAAQRSCDVAAAAVRGSSPLQVEKKIAEYIVRSVIYQIDDRYNQNIASALHFKKAQCSGIARAVKYLCDKNGIWCIEVDGTVSENGGIDVGPHAWNIVCIGGKYYHLDVTTMLASNPDKTHDLIYVCFNWSDDELGKTHMWNRSIVPECKDRFIDNERSGLSYGGGTNIYGTYTQGTQNNNITINTFTNMSAMDNIPIYSSMAGFRDQLEETGKQRKEILEFNLSIGGAPEEQIKLVQSSVNMVAPKIKDCCEYGIKYDGIKFIVTLKYRR